LSYKIFKYQIDILNMNCPAPGMTWGVCFRRHGHSNGDFSFHSLCRLYVSNTQNKIARWAFVYSNNSNTVRLSIIFSMWERLREMARHIEHYNWASERTDWFL